MGKDTGTEPDAADEGFSQEEMRSRISKPPVGLMLSSSAPRPLQSLPKLSVHQPPWQPAARVGDA